MTAILKWPLEPELRRRTSDNFELFLDTEISKSVSNTRWFESMYWYSLKSESTFSNFDQKISLKPSHVILIITIVC